MQIHELRPQHRTRKARRVGRGGKRGKTAGRGTKGQKSRAGAKVRPAIRDIIKKIPKRRGRGEHSFRPFRIKPIAIPLAVIEARFPDGAKIDPAALLAAGVVRKMGGRTPAVKIVGNALRKSYHFQGVSASESARAAIEAARGSFRAQSHA